jgi:hypothetical protein
MALKALYERIKLLVNYFFPAARLLEKTRDGSKLYRTYDSPATAFQRLIASDKVAAEVEVILMTTYRSLKPCPFISIEARPPPGPCRRIQERVEVTRS